MTQRYEAKCPHPDCNGVLTIRATTPGGEDYPCQCGACKVKLTWITSLIDGRYPVVWLVDKQQEDSDA